MARPIIAIFEVLSEGIFGHCEERWRGKAEEPCRHSDGEGTAEQPTTAWCPSSTEESGFDHLDAPRMHDRGLHTVRLPPLTWEAR